MACVPMKGGVRSGSASGVLAWALPHSSTCSEPSRTQTPTRAYTNLEMKTGGPLEVR